MSGGGSVFVLHSRFCPYDSILALCGSQSAFMCLPKDVRRYCPFCREDAFIFDGFRDVSAGTTAITAMTRSKHVPRRIPPQTALKDECSHYLFW